MSGPNNGTPQQSLNEGAVSAAWKVYALPLKPHSRRVLKMTGNNHESKTQRTGRSGAISPLNAAIVHINASLPVKMDETTCIACIRGTCMDQKWRPHILAFFLETPAGLIHEIVLAGAFTFEELMDALSRWKAEEYADEDTVRWIQEMAYLSMGRAAELGIARFV